MYKISGELASAILQYLAMKPYAEVNEIINKLQKIEPLEKTEDTNSTDE